MVDLTHNWTPPCATIHDNSEYFLTTETRPHFCFQSKREAEKGQLGGRGDNDNGQFQGNFPLQRPVIQACGRLRPLGSKDLDQAKCQKRQKATKTGAKSQADMEFVQNFTLPDFQAKNFTPSISPNFNSFSKKKHKK